MKYISLEEYVVHFLVETVEFVNSPSVCLKKEMSKLHDKKMSLQGFKGK